MPDKPTRGLRITVPLPRDPVVVIQDLIRADLDMPKLFIERMDIKWDVGWKCTVEGFI